MPVKEKGYGSALRGGIHAALGKWILMGDADDSYDFSEADRFVKKFQEGYELVMGCRLPVGGGTILPGAMPWKNRWLGNPVLSFIGRLFFKCPAHDFHCGLRGFTKAAFEKMDLQTTGMEFASEMVIKSTLQAVENRGGARHAAPGRALAPAAFEAVARRLAASAVHAAVLAALAVSGAGDLPCPRWASSWPRRFRCRTSRLAASRLNVGTLAVACMTVIVGFQLVAFAFFTKVFAIAEGLLPDDPKFSRAFKFFNLEKGIWPRPARAAGGRHPAGLGAVDLAAGGLTAVCSHEENLRRLIPAATLIVLGVQIVFSSFFMSALGLKTVSRKPPALPDRDFALKQGHS